MNDIRNKKFLFSIQSWIVAQSARLKKFRIVIDLAMVLTIVGLFMAAISFYRNELSSKNVIHTLNQIIAGQRETLEIIRTKGEIPSELTYSTRKNEFTGDRQPSSESRIRVARYYDKVNPAQLGVQGHIYQNNKSKNYWIGIRSGLQFWPQIRLPRKHLVGESFEYRIQIPTQVRSGAIALVEVGESTDKLFFGYQDYAVSNIMDVGFYFPHISDIHVMASENFQI